MEKPFIDFCQQHGVEPTEERYFFWLGGRHHDEPPIAYGYIGVGGEVLGLLDAIPYDIRPKPVPLYRRPVAPEKPAIPESALQYVWNNYDGDFVGFARWVEQYVKGKV